jgi:hypothetical protein
MRSHLGKGAAMSLTFDVLMTHDHIFCRLSLGLSGDAVSAFPGRSDIKGGIGMKFLYGDSDGRDKITAAYIEKIDQISFDQAFPFKEHIPMIDLSNACCRTLEMPSEIVATDMLIVATEHPERDLCLAEKICGSAQKAFLKLLFTPRQVTVKGFTNQVCYRHEFVFSEQLGRFLGLVASPEYARAGYV